MSRTASNSSRVTTFMPARMRSTWERTAVSASRLTPLATPAALVMR